LIAFSSTLLAQENINITSSSINFPISVNGGIATGTFIFSVTNVNLPGYPNAGDTEILINLYDIILPNGISDISSSFGANTRYAWTYDQVANTISGAQIASIGQLYSEMFTFEFETDMISICPDTENGFDAIATVINGGDDSSDNFTIVGACATVLPVELIAFTAIRNNQTVILDWKTANEINNSHFDIERSTDAVRFEKIAELEGSGNSYDIKVYSVTDKHPIQGTNYYRLKQVDHNGAFSHSPVRSVQFNKELGPIRIFPNPTTEKINISGIVGSVTVEIYSSDGRLQLESQLVGEQLDIQSLQLGTYILKILTLDGITIKVQKLIIE